MTLRTIVLLAALLALSAAGTAGAESADFAVYRGGAPSSVAAIAEAASQADVLVVGETHDDAVGHRVELVVLEAANARRPRLALSLEMFERDVQLVLDEYLAGAITESAFVKASRPWPSYTTDYAPLVEYCKAHALPVIAANAPGRYANLVAREGQAALAGLSPAARAFLPALPYSMDLPAGYDRELTAIFAQPIHTTNGPGGAMPSAEHLKEAQGLWDATMADSVARYLRAHPGSLVVQMNGAGHSDHGWGLVDRLRKLVPSVRVVTVSMRPSEAYTSPPTPELRDLADYVVLTRAKAGK